MGVVISFKKLDDAIPRGSARAPAGQAGVHTLAECGDVVRGVAARTATHLI